LDNIIPVTVSYTNQQGEYKNVLIPTYKEVKRKMNAFMQDSFDENVNVFRSRRGQWGEWFENWSRVGSKAKIHKQGWQ
jgi:hypothetical protein